MAINYCSLSNSPLSLLILSYEMLESCTKKFHRGEHIFGIIYNLKYDVHVTILNAHGFITHAVLWPRSVQAFLIELNGWSVVNLIKFVWFSEKFSVCQHLLFIKCSYETTNIFGFTFHFFTSNISSPEETDLFKGNTQVNYFNFESIKEKRTLGSTLFHSIKIFKYYLSFNTLRLSWHFNLTICIKSCAHKRFDLFSS